MSLEGENDFTGKLRLPLPPTFSGKPAEWEEWSWKFRAYLSMFDAQAARYLEQHENDEAPLTDEALEVHVLTEEGVAALDQTATAGRVTFSRKLHYLLANLTSESALLVVRQNYDSNGFETWRRLVKKFALPDAARHVSLLTQLLDFRFGSHTFEQDFNTWETIKTKYERQTGADLPDSVLVATLLNKTSGALQQHLRLNARTLTTYEDIKATIVEYYQSRHLIMSNSSSSNQGPAPMDIGGLKGKKGFGKRHVSANCPLGRVSAVDENATLDGSFEDWSVDDTWQVGDFEEEWWSDDLVAAVGLGWSDEEWWPAWDDGWSSTWSDWNDDTWSVVSPPPAVEKATSAPPSHAAEPKATSGAPVSAVTLGTPPARLSSAAKPKATPKATSKASGLAIAAITLGSMFAGTQSCFVSPTCDASLDCMLSGSIVFDGFGRSLGARSDVATWQLSPVCDLPLKNEANQTSLSNPTSLSDWGLEHLSSTFYDPYLAEHEVAVASVETGLETWILFDSGAAANCCPPDFAPDFPLLKLEERAPPLKSISGQTLQIYGRKLVAFELDGQRLWLNFYVCDVPYSVISVARLLQQGCKAVLTSEGSQLEGPTGATFPVTRHGSLLFLCPTLAEFDPNEYADFSKGFHEQFAVRPPPGLVAPTLKPTYYHADSWVLDEANATLTRLHKRGRATLFSPEGTKDRPVELKDLTGERVTVMNFEDGSSKTLNDDWRKSDDPRAKQDKYFKGKTVFKLASKPTGRRLVGKQSTLPRPEVHVEMPPPVPSSRTSTQKLSPEVVLRDHGEYADTFRKRVFDLVADEAVDPMKGLENFVKRSLDDVDPQTNEAYTHDTWVQLPTMWIRLHRQPRKNLFVPSERSEGGPNLSELSKARVTIQLDDHGSMKVDEDDWTLEGADRDVVEPFACGGATCFEKRDLYVKEIPEVAEPDLFETSARRPRGLPAPSEPTLTERKEHELTHLPFRSWCPICVRAKSKQNHSRTLKTKQPVVQLDYCFLGDNPEEPQVTLLTAVDLLSGMGLSCVVPAKGRSVYAQAELRRYILEIGRTFGILQIDPEPSLKALVAEFTSEGVIKIRSLRRRPPSEQLDLALVQSLTATPWDPRGTKVETDHFVFPPQQPRPGENLVEPPDDPDAIPENLGNAGDLAQELEQDMLRELQSTSETRAAADLPVPEGPMDAEELAERQDKRSHEEPTSSAERASSEPATSRRRVGVTTERKRDTSEVPEAATKVQRISSLVRSPDQQMRIFDLRISAVTTKQELEAGMSTCKPAPSPGTDALKKVSETAEALNPEEHKRYRKLVGQLLWMCNLRMDIMYAVKELSRGLASPTTDHWAKLKHLLRYLAGTKEYVQELRPNIRLSEKHSSLDVHTYVAAQNWRLVQPTFPAGETLLGLRDLAIEEAQHWTLEMHQRAFVQDTYASFSTFSNFWRHEVFMSILFSGLQKERLTIRQLLLIPRDPRTNFLLVVPLLFVLFPGLYHPGSRQYPGLYHSVHGPPLYFTFELQWITSLAIEMLGVHLFSPQEINFMPWTCYIVLPRSTWARLMQRLVTQRVLVITPADLVWTSGMLNVGFSLRSTLLFTIFNFQFHPGRAEYQESFVALGFSISGQTFGAMMSSGGNIWNRRYRDYFIKLPLLQLFHPAEIATLVSFTCTNQALTFARLGEMYHNFIQAETHLWLGHIPLHKAWLRPGEAELGDDETVDPHLVRRMMQYDLHRPKL
ncbi:RE2 [Symbiodinium natans]|uniref:RE2 protein n=1 Tax=Symbiodinium natans TaxID=878477 RepID=A0A812M152_9DINO|nr:RE2 [Symbiodinium natans]